ncbi:MAG: DoxX family protein [Bacteroidetes bacterium]|nr:DoxX family protein [Bacteroidota bacterium]
MKSLAILGRVLFAIPFGIIGLNHFFMTDVFLGMMTSFIPGGAYTILLTGVLLILASISIMINKYIKLTCFGLAALLFIFIVTIHIPGLFTPNSKLALVELLKDMALMGGAIMIAVHFDSPKTESTKE